MMVIGRPPFEGSSVKTTVENIKNGNFKLPSSLSSDCKDLILRLLTYDPKMRITID
jgi:serine/threonine protein kinase